MTAAGRTPAALLALASAAAFAAIYAVAVGAHAGRALDEEILNDALERHVLGDVAHVLVHGVSPVSVALAVIAILSFALTRRGLRTAVGLAIALAGANGSAALLKALLGDGDPLGGEGARELGAGFFPSGHVTALMSIVLATIVLTESCRARSLGALAGGLLAGGVAVSNVVAIVHHASDVVGGMLLATTWIAAVLAIACARSCGERRWPRAALVAAVLAVAAGAAGTAVAAALDKTAAPVASAGVVCAIAFGLAAAVAALAPRRARLDRPTSP